MKDIKNRIDNVKEESLKLMGIYFIVVLVTFITVILVYFIGLYNYNKNNMKLNLVELKEKVNDSDYELVILNEEVSLKDKCDNGCKFKTDNKVFTYYEIIKEQDSYVLDINSLYTTIGKYNIGNDISNLSIKEFSNYIVLYLIVRNGVRSFDEAIAVSNNVSDVIVSANEAEMEFAENSIIYYTYSCLKTGEYNAVKFKNEKVPFESTSNIISYENINLSVC